MIVIRAQFGRVYQFKITLKDIRPPVWRCIQVPWNYTFWDLHVAIQDAMGWNDCHLHEFDLTDPSSGERSKMGIPDEDDDFGLEMLPGWEENISDWFSPKNKSATYLYDFGDCWKHTVKLEKTLPAENNVNYPICVGGKRACPPDDVGGIRGYERFLEIMSNPDDEEYDEMSGWIGGDFDPECFDPQEVRFDDPSERFRIVFGGDV